MQDQTSIGPPKSRFPEPEQGKCPRCDSTNTKFCYYNDYNLSQPRHFCKSCRRYWTKTRARTEKNIIHIGKKGHSTRNEFLSSSNYLIPPICASSANKESNKPRGGPRDIAWQHGISMENGKKSRCNYCEKVMKSGGATRLKQHLAGGFTNVEQCLHCPPQVRITMVRLLKRSEDYRLEKEREKAGLQPRSERPLNGDQLGEDDEDKDLDVQHLQDASTPFQWTDQLSYELGSSSTQSFQMVHDFDDSSSRALNIKSDYRSSNTMKPKCGGKKGPWTAEEDQLLVSYMQQYGDGNWKTLPQKAGILRSHTSCRLRWTNNFRPDIKTGDFTREEEDIIMKLYGSLGNRWSAIAEQLPGRTETQIKDVWHTDLKKRLILNQSNPRAPHHSVELSNCEAKTGKKLKCTPKTDLIIVESVSAMSSPDIVSSSISDMDDKTGLPLSPVSIPEMDFSDNYENLFLDVGGLECFIDIFPEI